MHRCRWIAGGIVALVVLAVRVWADEAPRFIRLIDLTSDAARNATIDDTRKLILNPWVAANVIALPPRLPSQPALMVATGMLPGSEPVTVRFDIAWKPFEGKEEPLYRGELNATGWRPIRIDLSGHRADGAALVFRRRVTAGRNRNIGRALWGDPVIVPDGGPPARSVIFISIDTLRADHVGLYGYEKAHTPALDTLGRNGVWYEQAYSPSGWTVPSHASMFYSDHIPAAPLDPIGSAPGTARPLALAEILRRQGFLTAGFTGGGFMGTFYGMERGFDTFYAFSHVPLTTPDCPIDRFDGRSVFREAITWMEGHRHVPFFMLMHTYDVHDRCPFRRPNARGLSPWSERAKTSDLVSYYDTLIGVTDGLIEYLTAELDRLGLSRSTVIVVTSDHGEFFNEHSLQGHGCVQKGYEELMRVPLIISDPAASSRPGRISEPVSLVDIAPTILSLLRVPVPGSMQGTVLPGLGLEGRRPRAPIHAVCDDRIMVREGNDKLITSTTAAFPDEVYDVAADPHELNNLAGDGPRLARMRSLAAGIVAAHSAAKGATPAPTAKIDESTKEQLRALGY